MMLTKSKVFYSILVLVVVLLSCKGANQCIDYKGLNWCFEGDVEISTGEVLNATNQRDGLPFSVDISYIAGAMDKLKDQLENKEKVYSKSNIDFYQMGEREESMQISAGKIVVGSLIGIGPEGQYIVNYRGVNKNKIKRYLDLMMG